MHGSAHTRSGRCKVTRMRERESEREGNMKRAWREKSAATKWQKCNRSAQKLTVAAAVTTTTTAARVIPEMATEWPKKKAQKNRRGGEGERRKSVQSVM